MVHSGPAIHEELSAQGLRAGRVLPFVVPASRFFAWPCREGDRYLLSRASGVHDPSLEQLVELVSLVDDGTGSAGELLSPSLSCVRRSLCLTVQTAPC